MNTDLSNAFQSIANRMISAENDFIEILMNCGKITKDEAKKVLSVYRKLKVVKLELGVNTIRVKHGVYLESEVIANALAM